MGLGDACDHMVDDALGNNAWFTSPDAESEWPPGSNPPTAMFSGPKDYGYPFLCHELGTLPYLENQ